MTANPTLRSSGSLRGSSRYYRAIAAAAAAQALGPHVKYFTSEWWSNGCEGADDAFGNYRRYIESVRDRLPEAALAFDARHTLHDSEVKLIVSNFEASTVELSFLGWDIAFEKKTRYRLTFEEVFSFEQLLPQQEYVESELGDVGYWEWEALPEGTELRLLFASNAVFRLRFRGFSFQHLTVQASARAQGGYLGNPH